MISTDNHALLSLIRIGIGHSMPESAPVSIDWESMKELACNQGVVAIVWDAILSLYDKGMLVDSRFLDVTLKKQWIASAYHCEQRYSDYRQAIGELAAFYHSKKVKMMVLKGYGLSLNYPVPNHRPCGDSDVWLFGKQKTADIELTKSKGILVDGKHLHHTTFRWNGFLVENHYDMVNVYVSRSNKRIEKLFKKLAMDDSHSIVVDGQIVYLPSPEFHLLFLLRHAILHFTGEGLCLRQVLDWGLFIKTNYHAIDWPMVLDVIEQYGMTPFFECMNSICFEDLGFPASSLPDFKVDASVKNRVLESILNIKENHDVPSNPVSRLLYKYRLRKRLKWRHDLCYKESLSNHLWNSIWLHLWHPEMI